MPGQRHNGKTVKLLGLAVDSKLSFEPHLNTVCKKIARNSILLQEFQIPFSSHWKDYESIHNITG